ncbi:MAG: anti-sigma factor [Acidobacteriaceae bacterium]
MKCEKLQVHLPNMIFDPTRVPAEVLQHVKDCSHCAGELKELQATMQLLDTWRVPEPSSYFDTRLAVRLREARESEAPGWLERLRLRLLFGSNLHLRPAAAAAFALLIIVSGGSYMGVVSLNHTVGPSHQQAVSATVNDLELLDSSAQTLQQLASFDETNADGGPSTDGGSSSN